MLKKCSKLTINLTPYLLAPNNLKIVSLQPIEIKTLTTLKKIKNVTKHWKSIANYRPSSRCNL